MPPHHSSRVNIPGFCYRFFRDLLPGYAQTLPSLHSPLVIFMNTPSLRMLAMARSSGGAFFFRPSESQSRFFALPYTYPQHRRDLET